MKITFIRTPKPRRFVHKPIYYDPAKEEREEREERVKKDLGIKSENEPYKPSIKHGTFRQYSYDAPEETSNMHKDRQMSNIRLLVIIVILLIIAAALYFTSGAYRVL